MFSSHSYIAVVTLISNRDMACTVLSKAEREFIDNLKKGKIEGYSDVYRRQLKHRLISKRRALTDDLVLINEVWDKLQSL